jgi:hypothetical protein
MSRRQPRLSLIDIPMLIFGMAMAAPFVLIVVVPFTRGL